MQTYVWMFPPPHQVLVKSAIDHIVDCWRKDPTKTSACIVLSKGFVHLTSGAQGRLRLIYTYAKGAKLWLSPSGDGKPDKTTKTNCVMHVYMLDPMSPHVMLHHIQAKASQQSTSQVQHIDLLQEVDPTPLAFRFTCSCRPIGTKRQVATEMIYANILQDGGASVEFVSLDWVTRKGFKVKPTHTNWTVTVANQETVSVMGSVDIQINIHGYTDNIKFLVIPMAYDMIIGNRWAISRQIIVDYGKSETRVTYKGKEFILTPYYIHKSSDRTLDYPSKPDPPDSESASSPSCVLNYAQAFRHIHKGGEFYAIEVNRVPDPDIPPDPPVIPSDPPEQPDDPLDDSPPPTKKRKTKQAKDPPTQEQLDKDVRKAISELKASVQQEHHPSISQTQPMQRNMHGLLKRLT
jgi:hypothetical protein